MTVGERHAAPAYERHVEIPLALRVKPLFEVTDLQLRPMDLHAVTPANLADAAASQAVLSIAIQNVGPTEAGVRLMSLDEAKNTLDRDGPHRIPAGAMRRCVHRGVRAIRVLFMAHVDSARGSLRNGALG